MYGECVCSRVCVYVCVVGECVFTCVCSCVHTHMCVVGECCTLYLLYSHWSYVHMYYLFHTSGQPTYRACYKPFSNTDTGTNDMLHHQ